MKARPVHEEKYYVLSILRNNNATIIANLLETSAYRSLLTDVMSGDYTFFVPTDEAISFVLDTIGMTANELALHPVLHLILKNHIHPNFIKVLSNYPKKLEMNSGALFDLDTSLTSNSFNEGSLGSTIDGIVVSEEAYHNGKFDLALYFIQGLLVAPYQYIELIDIDIITKIRNYLKDKAEGRIPKNINDRKIKHKPLTAWEFYNNEQMRLYKGQQEFQLQDIILAQWYDLPELDRHKYKNLSLNDLDLTHQEW